MLYPHLTEALGLKNEDFSDEDQCQCMYLRILSIYSHPRFLIFFPLLSPLSLILLKRLFCNSIFLKCWSLYVCENLSKWSVKWRKTTSGMGGNIPGGDFLGGSFPRGDFPGESLMDGNLCVNSPAGIFLEPFSSYNVSLLIFQKLSTNIRLSTKRYIL